MKSVSINNEAARLEALRRYKTLDNNLEVIFDFVRLVAHICINPIALLNFINANRQSLVLRRAELCPLIIQQSDVVTKRKQAESVLQQVTAEKLQIMYAVAAKA